MSTDSTIKEEHRRLFEEGLKVRAAVIGSDYVDRSLKSATSFTWPGQELVTESVWGNIWTRPGLDLKQRSLIILSISIAQKSWHELALHTRGAINNGLSEIEIREAVLQGAVYCGIPTGLEALAVAEKTLNEMVEKGEYERPAA